MKPPRWSRVALAPLLIVGCTSTPVHYHTLVPAPADDASAAALSGYHIDIAAVRVPAQVDRYELVVRRSDGDITVADGELWVAALADEVRGGLLIELIRQLESTDTVPRAAPQGVSLRVEVERFESTLARFVLLQAAWHVQVKTRAGEASVNCRSSAYQRVTAGYEALVLGDQRAVAAVADEIAVAVRQMAGGGTAACPSQLLARP